VAYWSVEASASRYRRQFRYQLHDPLISAPGINWIGAGLLVVEGSGGGRDKITAPVGQQVLVFHTETW